MKIVLVFSITVWALTACSRTDPAPEVSQPGTSEVLATIDGAPVNRSDLDEVVGDRLSGMESQYRNQRYQLIRNTLEQMVADRLLEQEAVSRGISKEELVAAEIESKVRVTEQDVAFWYQQNQARLGGRSLQEVSPQVRQFLLQSELKQARDEFVKRLEEHMDVVYLLEPFRANLDTEGSPSSGPSDAPITLVEFSDFECPFCSQFVSTLDEIKKNYSDRVRIVFRQFPLDIHPHALKAAEASLCANDQGRFWEMHDLLFREQRSLDVGSLKEKAGRLGLNQEAFDDCLDSGRHSERVQRDLREGAVAGVNATPAIFVNGIPAPGGAIPYQTLSEVIEDELRRLE